MSNNRMVKIKILKKIAELGLCCIESFFPENYSYSRISREFLGFNSVNNRSYLNKKNFSNILSRLKRDGLVQRSGSKKRSNWKITPIGIKYIQKMEKESLQEDNVQRLVIFDIPEKDKKKRDWLRGRLIVLKYKMLQKSVWIGNVPLPEKFIHDISLFKLQSYIHIFSIQQSGTINVKNNVLYRSEVGRCLLK